MRAFVIFSGFVAGVFLFAGISGCTTQPASDAGFIAGSHFTNTPRRAQFLQRAWISPRLENIPFQQQYDAIYIARVNTSYLQKQSWWQSQNGRGALHQLETDTEALATHLRRQLSSEIVHYPGNHYRIAAVPGPRTLVIELAIVELVPSKAFWNTGAAAAGFVVPGAAALSTLGAGSIAIEGRLRDGGTGEVIAMFADRRQDQVAPINLRGMTWYGGSKKNIDAWAREGAEFLNLPPGQIIHRKSRLTLKPW